MAILLLEEPDVCMRREADPRLETLAGSGDADRGRSDRKRHRVILVSRNRLEDALTRSL
jgi:hypothetical protein